MKKKFKVAVGAVENTGSSLGYCCWLKSGLQVPFPKVCTYHINKHIHKYIVFLGLNNGNILWIYNYIVKGV